MKLFQISVITLVVLTAANGIACEKHPQGHQQPSSDSTKEQIQK
jgi:hypothetical protein